MQQCGYSFFISSSNKTTLKACFGSESRQRTVIRMENIISDLCCVMTLIQEIGKGLDFGLSAQQNMGSRLLRTC